MKIALFYNLNFGGAKRVVMEHAKGLKNNGNTVDLYVTNIEEDTFDPSPFCEKVYNYKINLNSNFPLIKRFIKDYKNFFALKNLHKRIAAEIDGRKYDVVLAHPDKFTQAPFVLRFLKTPSVYYCQEPLRIVYEYSLRLKENVGIIKKLYEEFTRLIRKRIDQENVRFAKYHIASCYHIRERMIESYDVYPHVSYPGINEQLFRKKNTKKRNVVLFMGNKEVVTDGYDLAENVLQNIPKLLRPELQIVSWNKNDNKRLTEEELVEMYNNTIVTLCLSRLETFGLVPLESMACGTPVIATNVSGHRETVINNETGFLVEFSPEEIAEKIIYLQKNPIKQKEFGRNARAHIKNNWSWKKRINELEAILKEYIK